MRAFVLVTCLASVVSCKTSSSDSPKKNPGTLTPNGGGSPSPNGGGTTQDSGNIDNSGALWAAMRNDCGGTSFVSKVKNYQPLVPVAAINSIRQYYFDLATDFGSIGQGSSGVPMAPVDKTKCDAFHSYIDVFASQTWGGERKSDLKPGDSYRWQMGFTFYFDAAVKIRTIRELTPAIAAQEQVIQELSGTMQMVAKYSSSSGVVLIKNHPLKVSCKQAARFRYYVEATATAFSDSDFCRKATAPQDPTKPNECAYIDPISYSGDQCSFVASKLPVIDTTGKEAFTVNLGGTFRIEMVEGKKTYTLDVHRVELN